MKIGARQTEEMEGGAWWSSRADGPRWSLGSTELGQRGGQTGGGGVMGLEAEVKLWDLHQHAGSRRQRR